MFGSRERQDPLDIDCCSSCSDSVGEKHQNGVSLKSMCFIPSHPELIALRLVRGGPAASCLSTQIDTGERNDRACLSTAETCGGKPKLERMKGFTSETVQPVRSLRWAVKVLLNKSE